MTFLVLAIFAGAGAETQDMEKLEALLFACRKDEPRESKTSAIEAISKSGDEAIPILVRALGGTYPERVAKKLKEEETELQSFRGDTSSFGIDYWAGEALVKMGQRPVPALLESFESQPRTSARVAGILVRIGDRRANPALIKILREKAGGWYMRAVAANGLRRLNAREAVPHLIDALEEASKEEFHSDMHGLADALAKLSGEAFGLNLVPERDTRSKAGIIPAHYDLPGTAAERRALVEPWKQWWKACGQEFLKQGK